MNVRRILIIATLMQLVPIQRDLSTAHAIVDTREMVLLAQVNNMFHYTHLLWRFSN